MARGLNLSLNANVRLGKRGLSARPYVRVGNGHGGLLALLFGPRIKL